MNERWLAVVGWEGFYEVSDHGRVRSVDRVRGYGQGFGLMRGRILKQPLNHGYPSVHLHDKPNRSEVVRAHILVLTAFAGPAPNGNLARHLDGNRQNNLLPNLKWGTPKENSDDTRRHGTNWNSRKTHCPLGHEYTPENTRIGKGTRMCKTCQRAYALEHMRQKRAEQKCKEARS